MYHSQTPFPAKRPSYEYPQALTSVHVDQAFTRRRYRVRIGTLRAYM